MPFRIGLSGLSAAQADLKVTGNNIANVGTIGFKQSRAEFADVYATSKFGSANTAIGSGVRLAGTAQQFTQGNIIFTENNLDMGIAGDGFFTMNDVSGNRVFTRNGQFKVDKDGYIVDNSNSNLQGYGVDASTNQINTGDVVDLQIVSTSIEPKATSTSAIFANLDAGEPVIAGGFVVDSVTGAVDPLSYNHTTSFTSYDSLGNPMQTSMYYQKTAANTWVVGVKMTDSNGNIFQNFDNALNSPGNSAATPPEPQIIAVGAPINMQFSTTGVLDPALTSPSLNGPPVGSFSLNFTLTSPVTPPGAGPVGSADQSIIFNVNDLTQYGADFSVTNLTQDGYTTGQLSGIDVDQSGVITARFTNGESNNLGQIFLTNFNNNQGLSQLGDNYWGESFSSGNGVVNTPGSGNAGLINSGALEDSNVNLTEQLINLITAQRNFQANAKTITTADTVTQTLIQI